MKKILALLLVAVMLTLSVFSVSGAEVYPEDSSWMNDENKGLFFDVTVDMWFAEYAHKASGRGLVNGTNPNPYVRLFMPDDYLTREQALAILNRIDVGPSMNIIGEKYNTGFADVPADAWYAKFVFWGVKRNVTNGVGGSYFGAGRAITREELASFMLRYVETEEVSLKAAESVTEQFADAVEVSEWAREAVEYMRANGILQGDENGNVRPGDVITRAEAVAMLVRFDEAIVYNPSKIFDFESFNREDVAELRLGVDVDGPDYLSHTVTDEAEINAFFDLLSGVQITGSETRALTCGTAGKAVGLYNKDGEKLWGYTFDDNCVMTSIRIFYLDKAYFTEYSAILTELYNDYYNK